MSGFQLLFYSSPTKPILIHDEEKISASLIDLPPAGTSAPPVYCCVPSPCSVCSTAEKGTYFLQHENVFSPISLHKYSKLRIKAGSELNQTDKPQTPEI